MILLPPSQKPSTAPVRTHNHSQKIPPLPIYLSNQLHHVTEPLDGPNSLRTALCS
jgi:hypothetical protein